MSEIIVTVEQGPLRGKVVKHIKSGEYYSFQGIPYAKPPLGHLRFKVIDTDSRAINFFVLADCSDFACELFRHSCTIFHAHFRTFRS